MVPFADVIEYKSEVKSDSDYIVSLDRSPGSDSVVIELLTICLSIDLSEIGAYLSTRYVKQIRKTSHDCRPHLRFPHLSTTIYTPKNTLASAEK